MGLKKIDIAYLALLVANLVGIILSCIFKGTVDIHLHDTMFVLSTSFLWKIFFLYNLLLFATNRFLSKSKGKVLLFQWIVYFVTIVLIILIYVAIGFLNKPHDYLDIKSFRTFDDFELYNWFLTLAFVILVALHALFWLYSIFTIFCHLFLKR